MSGKDYYDPYEEFESEKNLTKMQNLRYLNTDKYELLKLGEISLAEFGILVQSLGIYYRLPNTHQKTSKLVKKSEPGTIKMNSNLHILRIGLKQSVLEGYIHLFDIKKYYDGYKMFCNRTRHKTFERTNNNEEEPPQIIEDFFSLIMK